MNILQRYIPVTLLVLALAGGTPVLAADTYKVDPVHSALVFKIKHLGVAFVWGRINNAEGTIVYDPDDPAAGSVHITARAENIDTYNAKRDAHLKSPDFFNAATYPTLSFRSRSVAAGTDGTLTVSGDFTLHGVTRPLTVTVSNTGAGKDPWGGYRVGFETVFDINRSDFGMDFMMGGVADRVQIFVNVEAIRQ